MTKKEVNAVREHLKKRLGIAALIYSQPVGRRLVPEPGKQDIQRLLSADHIARSAPFCFAAIKAERGINEVADQAGYSNIHTALQYTNTVRKKMEGKMNLSQVRPWLDTKR